MAAPSPELAPSEAAEVAQREAPELDVHTRGTSDTQQGITCMAGGLVGMGLALGGLYSSPAAAGQVAALGLMVVSMLVCEFAFNALWGPNHR